ncbi:MAG TPA: DUF1707 domain-containing protein [Pseudomonadales bacterium]
MNPKDRPLDALREQTVDRLIMNYGHGRLSLDAFQRRLDQAFDATAHEELLALTADLDLQVDAGYVERKREELGFRYADESDEVEWIVDVLGGSDRAGDWVVPGELRVVTVMGGSNIDLTDARFASPVVRVRVLCMFGGVDVFVPEGANVTVKTFNILGGTANKVPRAPVPDAPRIVIEGLVMFGGVDVKVKRTLKERMLEFADSLRSLVGQAPVR